MYDIPQNAFVNWVIYFLIICYDVMPTSINLFVIDRNLKQKEAGCPLSNKCKRIKRIPWTSQSVYNQQYKCATQGNLSQPKEGKHFTI